MLYNELKVVFEWLSKFPDGRLLRLRQERVKQDRLLKEEGPLAGEPVPDKMVKDTAAVTVVPAPVGKHVLLPTKVVPNFESSITEKRVNDVTDSVSVNVANQKEVNVVANVALADKTDISNVKKNFMFSLSYFICSNIHRVTHQEGTKLPLTSKTELLF